MSLVFRDEDAPLGSGSAPLIGDTNNKEPDMWSSGELVVQAEATAMQGPSIPTTVICLVSPFIEQYAHTWSSIQL